MVTSRTTVCWPDASVVWTDCSGTVWITLMGICFEIAFESPKSSIGDWSFSSIAWPFAFVRICLALSCPVLPATDTVPLIWFRTRCGVWWEFCGDCCCTGLWFEGEEVWFLLVSNFGFGMAFLISSYKFYFRTSQVIPLITYKSSVAFFDVCLRVPYAFITSSKSTVAYGTDIWLFFRVASCMCPQMVLPREFPRTVLAGWIINLEESSFVSYQMGVYLCEFFRDVYTHLLEQIVCNRRSRNGVDLRAGPWKRSYSYYPANSTNIYLREGTWIDMSSRHFLIELDTLTRWN